MDKNTDKRRCYHPQRQARQKRAAQRQAERDKRTIGDQLRLIEERPGQSLCELNRLLTQLDKETGGSRAA